MLSTPPGSEISLLRSAFVEMTVGMECQLKGAEPFKPSATGLRNGPCLIRLSSLSDYVIREAKRPGEGLSNPRGAQSMEAGKKGTEPS